MEQHLRTFESGSIPDWGHTPNLTPRGFEIKRDELYVLNGDTLIKAYHLLMSQRMSALQMVAKQPPTNVAEIEEYLSLTKHVNMVLYHILHSLPLASILVMQEEETRMKEEKKHTLANKKQGLSLKEILDKFHLSEGGTKDENSPPTPPPQTPPPAEE